MPLSTFFPAETGIDQHGLEQIFFKGPRVLHADLSHANPPKCSTGHCLADPKDRVIWEAPLTEPKDIAGIRIGWSAAPEDVKVKVLNRGTWQDASDWTAGALQIKTPAGYYDGICKSGTPLSSLPSFCGPDGGRAPERLIVQEPMDQNIVFEKPIRAEGVRLIMRDSRKLGEFGIDKLSVVAKSGFL